MQEGDGVVLVNIKRIMSTVVEVSRGPYASQNMDVVVVVVSLQGTLQ